MSETTTTTTSTTSTSSELSENIPEEMKRRLSDLLIKSVEKEDLTFIKGLLDIGADVNYRNGLPLKTAIDNDNTEIIDVLSKYGVKTNFGFNLSHMFEWSEDGTWCPLRYSIEGGHKNSVKKFIDLEIDPTKISDEDNLTTAEFASVVIDDLYIFKSKKYQNEKFDYYYFTDKDGKKYNNASSRVEIATMIGDYRLDWLDIKKTKKRRLETTTEPPAKRTRT